MNQCSNGFVWSGMTKAPINIVWLKRDLRLSDHEPLVLAERSSMPVLIVYCFEPTLLQSSKFSLRHWRFIYQSLEDLKKQLTPYQLTIQIFHRSFIQSLDILKESFDIQSIFSHQETGNKLTFDRDKAVKAYCNKNGIHWIETAIDGIIRGLRTRREWEIQLTKYFKGPIHTPNLHKIISPVLPDSLQKKLQGAPLDPTFKKPDISFQTGGPSYAIRTLNQFLKTRVKNYSKQISSPALSPKSCSRLSTYLAYGNVSSKVVWQMAENYKNAQNDWSINNFQTRLWWRSHYLQKLESMWQIEFEPINPGMNQLDRTEDEAKFAAWATGHTGFPMVDASMRCLIHTGWINFRMRAMLVTFASFALWLDWKIIAHHLGNLFLDYEPGIHYPQIQMQAGLSGYHTLRIFNPMVQSQERDPDGAFVRRWVPELRDLDPPYLFKPWEISPMEKKFLKFNPGSNYIMPIVDYDQSVKFNKDRYWQVRCSKPVIQALPKIWKKLCIPSKIEEYKKGITPEEGAYNKKDAPKLL